MSAHPQPIELCTLYANQFQALNARLAVSSDFFVRTTMPEHHATCHWLLQRATDAGDIYLGSYE